MQSNSPKRQNVDSIAMTHRIQIIIRMHPLQITTFLRVVHCNCKTLGLDHLSVATTQNV